MKKPKLSVITICNNDLKGLQETISSYAFESEDIEYIIIDGGSSDGTSDYLESLSIHKLIWISEPDNGIYDAMNKGLKLVRGEYVIFMNAGDLFYSQDTLSNLITIIQYQKPDVIFGETMLVNSEYEKLGLRSDLTTRKLPDSLKWNDMIQGMLVCHQSFVVRRELAPQYILDNLSADIDWQIKCLKQVKNIVRYDGIICQYLLGGVSQQKHFKSLKDRFSILSNHYGLCSAIIAHIKIILRAIRFKLG
jgi:glycosyltransferase involved in cell wall biosynthesis